MKAVAEKPTLCSKEPAQNAVAIGGNRGYRICKRLFDIAFSISAGITLIFPMLIIAIIIRLDSKGPALFKQERLGKNGKPFIMYKFRTMRLDAEINGPQWAQINDTRCTNFGKILRKSRMDELPQIINILRGEMSVVGPRPERACFYDSFSRYIPNFRDRLVVQPGLTGHAQVNGGYHLKPEEKIVYDMEYIAARSFTRDMQCIWKTVQIICTYDGEESCSEKSRFL